MKKIFYSIITILFIFILVPRVNAISTQELNELLSGKTLKFEVYGQNSNDWDYDISEVASGLIDRYTEDYEIVSVRNNNKNAYVLINMYDTDKETYEDVEIKFVLKPYGVRLTKDNFNTTVGKELELNAINDDYKYNRSKITIDVIDFVDEDYVKLKTKSNKVTFKEPGIYSGIVYFKEKALPCIEVYFYVDLQDKLDEVLNDLTEIEIDKTYFENKSDIELAELMLINSLYTNNDYEIYIEPKVNSHSSYVNEEEGIVNLDFEFVLNSKTYSIKKENVKIKKYGISLKVDRETIAMNVGDEFNINYESYSNVNWISSDPSVASVDENGKVTALKSGVSYIIGDYGFHNFYASFSISVRPENIEEFKADLTNKLNEFIGEDKKIEVPGVYGSMDYYTMNDYLYEKIKKDNNDDNISLNIEFDDDYRTANVNLNYSYDGVKYNNETMPYVPYCDNYAHEEEDYYDGYSCGTDSVKVDIVYANDKEDFDNSLLSKAQELAKKIKSKTYPSYINGSIQDILELRNNYSQYEELLINNSYIQSLIKNDDGFTLKFETRGGSWEIDNTTIFGLCYIEKDGIIYALGSEDCGIKQSMKLNTLDDSESGIKKAIKAVIQSEIESAKVSVSRTPGETKEYDVTITEEDSEPYTFRTYVYVLNNKIKDTPVLTVKNANDNALLISWNSVKYAEKYILYRSTDNVKWTKVTTLEDLTYTDTNLIYGKKYYYKVKAQNTVNGKTSKVVSGKTIPNKVTNLRILDIGSNNVKLSYNKVDVSGYEIYKSTNKKTWTKVANVNNSDTLEYDVQKLLANKKYYFKVRAYKIVSGKKVYGSFSSVLSTKTAPDKPVIKLSIRSEDAMNLLVNTSLGATKYIVQKSTDGENYVLFRELEEAENIIEKDHEFGQTYYYRVKACNSANKCSSWNIVSLMQTTQVPKFTLTTKNKKVIINITPVTGADGYEIYRKVGSKKEYTLVKELADEKELLKYVDTTITDKTYYYKVRSYKVVGEQKVYSKFSKDGKITSK